MRAASGGVCVDRFEEALQGRRFSEPVDGVDPDLLIAIPANGIMPQVNVSEAQAEVACEHAAKRLCTESEWAAACRGPNRTSYPYGNEHVDGACNEGKPRPPGATRAKLDAPALAESRGGIEPGGSRPRCVTPTGLYDLHGNVHEWVSDGSNLADPSYGMFLGGYFADSSENGVGCAYKTKAHLKTYHDYSTGFRCCKAPTEQR